MSTPAPDYSFLWKPRWILSHLFILALVVTFVSLGFWQLRRLDERRTYNALVESRQDLPAATVAELLPAGPTSTSSEVDDVIYRPLTITGTYSPDQEVLVRNRTYSEVPGYWVLTPLVQRDGTAVVVNRGWVPFGTTNPDGPWTDFAPPTGVVTVEGKVQASQARSSGIIGGPKDADDGTLRTLSRVDIGRLQQQVDETLYPISVDLTNQDPAQVGLLPVSIPAPELDEGPHLNYAGQWFIFATLTLIVYPLLMRRVARNKGAERAQAESDAAEPEASGVVAPEASVVARRVERGALTANERTRTRLLEATLSCVERWGLEKTSLEDVAREAGLSRATVYRYFAGGREQLVHETVAWEVGRFFERIEREIAVEPDLSGKLRRGLMFGHQAVEEHALLQRILATEPEALLAELSNTIPLIEQAVRAYLLALLRSEQLNPGVSARGAADYLTRLFMSYVGSQGQWDFTDRDEVDELVRTQFLAGVIA